MRLARKSQWDTGGVTRLRSSLYSASHTPRTSSQYFTLDNVVLTTARNAAIRAINTTSISVTNAVVQNLGSMAINASGGFNFSISDSVVRHAGNGAIFFYAGDRVTLTSAGHEVAGSSVSYSNRYMFCYTPMVALADCGNAIRNCELFGGPHQGSRSPERVNCRHINASSSFRHVHIRERPHD